MFVSFDVFTSAVVVDESSLFRRLLHLLMRFVPGAFRRFHISRAMMPLNEMNVRNNGRKTNVNIMQ
jgi:hypothetical protein